MAHIREFHNYLSKNTVNLKIMYQIEIVSWVPRKKWVKQIVTFFAPRDLQSSPQFGVHVYLFRIENIYA